MKYTFTSFILNLLQGQQIPEPQMLWQDRFFIGLFSFHSFCFHCDFLFFFLKIIDPYVLTQGAWLPTEVDKYVQKNVPATHPMQTAVQQTGNWGSQVHPRHRISFVDVSDKASLSFQCCERAMRKAGKLLLCTYKTVMWKHDSFSWAPSQLGHVDIKSSKSSASGTGWQNTNQLCTRSCVTQPQKDRTY